ncbi:snaclec trimecetin subunit beta-like isoform X1 [Pomacea canaliculata]|uniref:snaclec trimecetin subunit beta-like isoform X1 n=2 Tax=Pomacea canaliculata TaxID=400727 RepID=UPI000D73CD75|nr:snaclec trimecetin subunit beta-like isoform X1 [Pomacea canaliculata]
MTGNMLTSTAMALILMSVLKFSPAAAACPNDWKQFQHSCYGVADQLFTYAEALTICTKEAGDLLQINSESENRYIARLLPQNLAYSVWLGITDLFEEGVWMYSGRGTDLTYTKWSSNQPDNYNGMEDCAALNITTKLWYDTHCGSRLFFVCEVEQENY